MSFSKFGSIICFTFLLTLLQIGTIEANDRLKLELISEGDGFFVQLKNVSDEGIYIEKQSGGWYGCGNLEVVVNFKPKVATERIIQRASMCSMAMPTADFYTLLPSGEVRKLHFKNKFVTEQYSFQKGTYSFTAKYRVRSYSFELFRELVERQDDLDFFVGELNSGQLKIEVN